MADPNAYSPSYNFSDWQAINPSKPLPAAQVDNELANIATSTEQLTNALKDLRRSDGQLKNGVVTYDSLSPAVKFALGLDPDLSVIVNNIGSISAVAAIDDEIVGVYGIRTDVPVVAANVATIAAVAAQIAAIGTVSANISGVITAATNIANINAAAGNAQLAKDYATKAEDSLVQPGFYSAFHWAQKAQATVASKASLTGVETLTNKTLTTPVITRPLISGVVNAGNAAAGDVGEMLSSFLVSGSALAMTSGTPRNILSLALTAGDWDVEGTLATEPGAATVTTVIAASISLVSGTPAAAPTADGYAYAQASASSIANGRFVLPLSRLRVNVASTTTVYLVGSALFSGGTLGGFGALTARRVR